MSQLHNLSAIHIKDINLWAHVGVLESERIHGQRFLLDLSFWLELDESSKLDKLDKSIDYSEAIKAVKKLSFEIKCLTIEYFSDQIMKSPRMALSTASIPSFPACAGAKAFQLEIPPFLDCLVETVTCNAC